MLHNSLKELFSIESNLTFLKYTFKIIKYHKMNAN